MGRSFLIILLTVINLLGCKKGKQDDTFLDNTYITAVVTNMTELMIHDVTNPPLAARFFAYTTLAGYEVIAQNNSRFVSMHGTLNEYPQLNKPDSIKRNSYRLSALVAMIETAKKLQPSGPELQKLEDQLIDTCKQQGLSAETIEQSIKYGIAISKQILAYAKADGYNKTSNFKRYTPLNGEGTWYPTPPAFFAAVEPYFNTVRPFTLDSCNQFIPPPPAPFSKDKNSAFFKMMTQCYVDSLNDDHRAIAAFWDCNPFAMEENGHLMVGIKKISPGAHWMGITGIACKKSNKNFDESMEIFKSVAVGLMDAFICCWDEKYRSNRIRPETAIRKYLDPSWAPLIQTPPFPEYLSGHSVISGTSSTILTHYFGDKFEYTDSVEVKYGLPPRSFPSFNEAAIEAGISRLYGGIHFIDAIDNGRDQGIKVGNWVINKTKKP